MATLNKKQANNSAKEKLYSALRPIKAPLAQSLAKILTNPKTKMPSGKNANTETFILGLSISYSLFTDSHSALMKNGKALREYTREYAKRVPKKDAPLVNKKFNELINKKKP